MLRCLLVFLAAVLLCAWLSPSKKLRESALQALDSSLRCGLDSLDAEHTENAEAAAVPLQRRREVSSQPSAAPTSTRSSAPVYDPAARRGRLLLIFHRGAAHLLES